MDPEKWKKLKKIRERFRNETENLERSVPNLKSIQQKLADSRGSGKNSSYIVETPVVYNTALDDISANDEIKLILAADNPGRREQAAENRRYLVGPSGKLAARFFKDNPSLGIDFAKNVIILNKTPIHTSRTNELREICRIEEQFGIKKGNVSISSIIDESQIFMAELLFEFHSLLDIPVFIIGYSEMKNGGIFEKYTNRLKELYAGREMMYKQIFFYRHFSMNQFTIDLKKQSLPGESVPHILERIGSAYRMRILAL